MTINYIVKGFDKDVYKFDAVVVPVKEDYYKGKHGVWGFDEHYLEDFRDDFNEIIQGLQVSSFKSNVLTAVKSEKTGIYYIFIMVRSCDHTAHSMGSKNWKIYRNKHYIHCCEEMIECIKNLDVKKILIHPMFNKADFNINVESDFLANTLKSNIDRFTKKDIYILVADLSLFKFGCKTMYAFQRMKTGRITLDECEQIYVKEQIEKSMSPTNKLTRIAEIETIYKEKSIMQQFHEDMNNSTLFLDEYLNTYSGTDTELAEDADISNTTISKIRSHTYKAKSKTVIIALAIALNLTVDDRKRFINSAGFSYPNTEQDRFIEQQLRKKKYTSVGDFNKDIEDEYPEFIIETRLRKNSK